MNIKRRDTPEAREYWDFIEKTAAHVRSHALCFPNFCTVTGEGRCEEQEHRSREGRCRHCGALPPHQQEQEERKN